MLSFVRDFNRYQYLETYFTPSDGTYYFILRAKVKYKNAWPCTIIHCDIQSMSLLLPQWGSQSREVMNFDLRREAKNDMKN
jgi:hypothetical protein